jgi:DNA-binding beta-propeller fold protein YncE
MDMRILRSHLLRGVCFTALVCVVAFAGCSQEQEEPQGQVEKSAEIAAKTPEKSPPAEKTPTDPNSNQPKGPPERQDKAPKLSVVEPADKPWVPQNPYGTYLPKAPSLDGGTEWINTAGPLQLKDVRGKFVLLDFWTYCCINCIHILPELKKLEHAYPNELVVIGVHSAKFDGEKETKNIREAVARYEIEHPVINDAEHVIWKKYRVGGWPAMRLIDPEGRVVWEGGGEQTFEFLDQKIKEGLDYYRKKGLLDETPLRFDLETYKAKPTPLRYPGKILADPAGNRLFITDSNHNRIVVTKLDGTLIETIGSGAIGSKDGDYSTAEFDHPQGVALHQETLYVADTENHTLRKVDLKTKKVTTIAGVGEQNRDRFWPGTDIESIRKRLDEGFPPERVGELLPERYVGPPMKTAINSPWALWVHGNKLYIAMAGHHQIWAMTLDEKEIGPYAGTRLEDILDGPLLPKEPYSLTRRGMMRYSAFAQPSGLASDGTHLYVADSEGSSIRAVPFDPKKMVSTVVGTAHLAYGRLFKFGDIDGKGEVVRLQHALGVAYSDGKLYVADTYNNKVKVIDIKEKTCKTIAGTGEAGADDNAVTFDEPAGISIAGKKVYVADTNNHAIRVIDLNRNNQVSTLQIKGLSPPRLPKPKTDGPPRLPNLVKKTVEPTTVKVKEGKISVSVKLTLPEGYKLNPLAPMAYFVDAKGDAGPINRAGVRKLVTLSKPALSFVLEVPISGKVGKDQMTVTAVYYYCREGAEGICKVGSVVWTVPIEVSPDSGDDVILLKYSVESKESSPFGLKGSDRKPPFPARETPSP